MARRQLTLDNTVAAELAGSEDSVLRELEGRIGCDLRLRGNVLTLAGTIGSDGYMKDGHALSSPNGDLAQASVDAVRHWGFDPTLLDGVPMDTLMEVTVSFRTAR